eukprot:TRINITY_DN4959_c0_g1_i2.p1 TRINITY_DN4959_c0_g1~~TRINITY_DN4959_c0_g1_i2.p1  ORF type:complete len:111 (+),score=4.33 TRINITY_DN4959_c0_g1_i2:110-442(+)
MYGLETELAGLNISYDKNCYRNLNFDHSKVITSFRSHASCSPCFIDQYQLDREVVQNIWTRNTVYQKQNMALVQGHNTHFTKMYTLLLSESIFDQYRRDLPSTVYRGLRD